MLRKGSLVMHPHHGPMRVAGRQTMPRSVVNPDDGTVTEHPCRFVTLEGDNGLVLHIPVERAAAGAVRPPIGKEDVSDVMDLLGRPPSAEPDRFARRVRNYEDALATGDIYRTATVVRQLLWRLRTVGRHSPKEQRLYQQALDALAAELAASRNSTTEQQAALVEAAVQHPGTNGTP